MNKKRVKRDRNYSVLEGPSDSHLDISERPNPFHNLQKFLSLHQTANFDGKCCCQVCRERKPPHLLEKIHYMDKRRYSNCVLRELVDCLMVKGRKSLRLYLPDICFFQDNVPAAFYCTNSRDQRIRQPYPILPEKQLESILRHHRHLYLESMKILFERNIQGSIKFGEVHQNYSTTILPTVFYEGLPSGVNTRTIHQEKRLVVHRNRDAKLQLPVVASGMPSQEKDEQQYVVMYSDKTYQMLNQVEFDSVMNNRKAHGQMLYIKSYIKPGSTEEYTHEYRAQAEHNLERWGRAQILSAILNEEITVYDERYRSEEFFDEQLEQLRGQPEQYIQVQVYRILSYLGRLRNRRTTYLRSRWVVNDLNNYYLNDVLEWEWEAIPQKDLPPLVAADYNPKLESILHDENYFVQTFKNTSRSKHKPLILEKSQTVRLKQPSKALRSMSTIDETTLDTHASVRYDSSKRIDTKETKNSRTLDPNEARVRRNVYSLSRQLPKKKNFQLQPIRLSEQERLKHRGLELLRNAIVFK